MLMSRYVAVFLSGSAPAFRRRLPRVFDGLWRCLRCSSASSFGRCRAQVFVDLSVRPVSRPASGVLRKTSDPGLLPAGAGRRSRGRFWADAVNMPLRLSVSGLRALSARGYDVSLERPARKNFSPCRAHIVAWFCGRLERLRDVASSGIFLGRIYVMRNVSSVRCRSVPLASLFISR